VAPKVTSVRVNRTFSLSDPLAREHFQACERPIIWTVTKMAKWQDGCMTTVAAPRRFARTAGRILIALTLVVVLVVVGFLAWASTPMRGERGATIEVWTNPNISVTSTDHSIIMTPTSAVSATSSSGLVFIPGARVDPYAYMYVMSGIVEAEGVTVVITKPTLNLALFDVRPLTDFTADAPAVTAWYLGGHSLGGVRSCMLADTSGAADTDAEISGLILFASYCANDLSSTGLPVLSIGGSNDLLSTPKKITDAAPLLPAGTPFVEIDGANHAQFGNYGAQPGDGEATISSKHQRAEITRALATFLAAGIAE
jgi:pimeloyl-ACP methyl ester carboxylesterase